MNLKHDDIIKCRDRYKIKSTAWCNFGNKKNTLMYTYIYIIKKVKYNKILIVFISG